MLLTASNVSILPILSENDFVVSAGTASDAPISGKCGEVTWNLDSEGTLTISGEGAMIDRNDGYGGPWDSYTEDIVNVIIENGVTNIGGYAFCDCVNLTSITIPDSVTNIGDLAFHSCSSLTSITISEGVTSIGRAAFADCKNLTSITIPDSVTSIGDSAFRFTSLTSVTIPESVKSIGKDTFEGCKLTSIRINNPECVIGDSSDTIFENATIYGYEGSTAQAYAEKYERKFVSIDAGQSSTTTVPPAVVDGDSNGDGVVNLADAILILQSIGNPDKYRISESHLEAADVYQRGSGITSMDALYIQKYLLRLIDTLPAE